MLAGSVMMPPGQLTRTFTVMRAGTRETSYGREVKTQSEPIGEIKAVLASATPIEVERWRQLNHPVSHKIIMKGKPDFKIVPGDIMMCGEKRFDVIAVPYDIGGMGHFTIFNCNERIDAHGYKQWNG